MGVKFLGQFLLEEGVITDEQLRDALQLMRERNPVLGSLAADLGWITSYDASRVNLEQRRRDLPFGKLAVEMGLLTEGQVDELVQKQQERRIRIGEALVELGVVEQPVLDAAIARFELEQATYRGDALATAGSTRVVEELLDILPRMTMRVTQIMVKLQPPVDFEPEMALPHVATIRVTGSESVAIGLYADEVFSNFAAAAMIGEAGEAISSEVYRDVLGELLNILLGNVLAALERQGHSYELSPPDLHHLPGGTAYLLGATHGRVVLTTEGIET